MKALLLFDLDGTLIDSDHHIHERFMVFLHESVQLHRAGLRFDDFLAANDQMHAKHGSSIRGWQLELGLDDDWMHSRFTQAAPHLAEAVIAKILPDDVLLGHLDKLRSLGFELAVLTHSDDAYAHKTMKHAGLLDIIPESHVFGMARVKALKTGTTRAYDHVLNQLNAFNRKRAMVENIAANLAMAQQAGFTAVLTNCEQPSSGSPNEIPVNQYFRHIHDVCLALQDFK